MSNKNMLKDVQASSNVILSALVIVNCIMCSHSSDSHLMYIMVHT